MNNNLNRFDIVIPIGPHDIDIIESQIEYTKKNIIGYRNIYLISCDPSIIIDDCITINENIFPFNLQTVIKYHGRLQRNGWYLQQLLKLYSGFVIPNILERYLVIDADTFFLKPTIFIYDNKCLYNYGTEYNKQYFIHMLKLNKNLEKMELISGICHHMMFETKYIKELMNMVENEHNDTFYNVFLKMVTEVSGSGASEYEMYFNYMLKYHTDKILIRELKWIDGSDFNGNYDYISNHSHIRNNKIVLVCINNFQEYILDNIRQLIRLNHKNIYILTNKVFFPRFKDFINKITLINIEELQEDYNYYSNTTLDKNCKNGFWALTSLRFFYIYQFMKKYNIKDVIHLENDVLIYHNCNDIIYNFDKKYLYVPFDTFTRNIASIVYIPSHEVLKIILDNYNYSKNDMENFYFIKNKTNLIKTLPIFPKFDNNNNDEIDFVSENYHNFNYIFDAAAMGQYIGGIDPLNDPNNTVGFVNETCIIKYDKFTFIWKLIDNIKRPFLVIDNKEYNIFNLHIHHKDLYNFM